MEGYELPIGGLALMVAFLTGRALKEYYKNWQVRKMSQGNGPANRSYRGDGPSRTADFKRGRY